jgi:hypothetical protein
MRYLPGRIIREIENVSARSKQEYMLYISFLISCVINLLFHKKFCLYSYRSSFNTPYGRIVNYI